MGGGACPTGKQGSIELVLKVVSDSGSLIDSVCIFSVCSRISIYPPGFFLIFKSIIVRLGEHCFMLDSVKNDVSASPI